MYAWNTFTAVLDGTRERVGDGVLPGRRQFADVIIICSV